MEFTSLTFLFLFLPLLVAVYLFAQPRFRSALLLTASLAFLWGRPSVFLAYALLVAGNFFLSQWIEKSPASRSRLTLGIVFNLAILLAYKVFTTFQPLWFAKTFERVLPDAVETYLLNLVYPIGLSYVALQTISYLVDVARGTTTSEKNILRFALYVTFFPKIATGPIALYRDLRADLSALDPSIAKVANGLRRFAIGLVKKSLIADSLAKIANPAFNLPSPNFSPQIAWLALLAFTLQIYYDFSGFTDMAIGLGRVFGFTFPENFNQPFAAKSIGEFWRRWHMSLSAWFREYVFYPLERRRLPVLGQQLNILIVFFLHGSVARINSQFPRLGTHPRLRPGFGIHCIWTLAEVRLETRPNHLRSNRCRLRLDIFPFPKPRICAPIYCATCRRCCRHHASSIFIDAPASLN